MASTRTTPTKKAPAKRAAKPVIPVPAAIPSSRRKELLSALDPETKQALAQAVMDFDEPSICPEGRGRFLKEFGLPAQPARLTGTVRITVPLASDQIIASGYDAGKAKVAATDALTKQIGELLAPLGITVSGTVLNKNNSSRYY